MNSRNLLGGLLLGMVAVAAAQMPAHAPVKMFATSEVKPVGKPVARVNGEVLTDQDLQREINAIFPYARQHNGGIPKAMEPEIRKGAMQMLVFEELVYQEAKRRQLIISPARVDKAMADFRKQFKTSAEYQQVLQQDFHGSTKLIRAKVERSLLIEKLLKLDIGAKATITETQAKTYYDSHLEVFRIPESFSFQTISMVPPDNASPAQVQEARRRAQAVLPQAKAARNYEEFGLLAEKVSEDDFRVNMGDHKAADRSKLPDAVVRVASALQPGQVSDLLEFDNVSTIIRLTVHNPAGHAEFEEVKTALRAKLSKDKTEELRKALDQRLRKNATIEEL